MCFFEFAAQGYDAVQEWSYHDGNWIELLMSTTKTRGGDGKIYLLLSFFWRQIAALLGLAPAGTFLGVSGVCETLHKSCIKKGLKVNGFSQVIVVG